MRAISLVNRIEFEFNGNVLRNALTLGDVDNDGHNEIVVGNINGDIAIFKGKGKFQTITNLTLISCIAVGDATNQKSNVLVVITGDGWCHLYSHTKKKSESKENVDSEEAKSDQNDNQPPTPKSTNAKNNSASLNSHHHKKMSSDNGPLIKIHTQRIPANSKDILIGDIDGDGMMEVVLGLTDRVVRSYRWVSNPKDPNAPSDPTKSSGLFIALNKWECANQIGSITLHHYLDGKAALLIAQPGGTFMRIRCHLESLDTKEDSESADSDSSLGENITGSIDYQFLGISRMRNQNISTEILGDLKSSHENCECECHSLDKEKECDKFCSNKRPYAIATLDGTIMLVENEVILWAFAVDHQTFALNKLDVTGNGSDDIVVCSWDGQTYILDQEKNSVRFHLNEEVQAFTSGYYSAKINSHKDVTSLVYVTFKNTIIIYYDIPLKELVCKKFEPTSSIFTNLLLKEGKTQEEADHIVAKLDEKQRKDILKLLLYNVQIE